jgi:RND family efflux transporter MFP subunit
VEVDMAMNLASRAFRALVEFENPQHNMKAGTTVEIRITTSLKSNAIVVDQKNIREEKDSGKEYTYVINNNKAEKRYVTTGSKQGLNVEILKGLKTGDHMVVEGQLLLENGSKVKIIRSNQS